MNDTKQIIQLLEEIRDLLKVQNLSQARKKSSSHALRVNGKTSLIQTSNFNSNKPFKM